MLPMTLRVTLRVVLPQCLSQPNSRTITLSPAWASGSAGHLGDAIQMERAEALRESLNDSVG